jgi:uncharacterized protein (DUF2147 family)
MTNHVLTAAMGLLTAALLVPCSQSQAATVDPTGYWYKPDAERESKIQVFKCGKAKAQLCAKIIWLKDPTDSKGKALHDIRNEDPSMRDRPIVGLTIFSGMVPSAPETWTGQIYNPEDGHTYAATLTLLSRKEIKLRGCKAWLLCGEKQWLRTSAPEVLTPAAPAEGTQQIEASADPSPAPSHAPAAVASAAPASAQAAAVAPEPSLAKDEAQAMAEPQAAAEPQSIAALPKAEIATPAPPPAAQDAQPGYGFLSVSTTPDTAERVSGENVSSMIVMTKPIASAPVAPPSGGEAAVSAAAKAVPAEAASAPNGVQTAVQAEDLVPLPVQKPKAKPKPVATAATKPDAPAAVKPVVTAAAKPAPQAAPAEQGTPVPQDAATAAEVDPDAQAVDAPEAATAEASMVDTPPLTRRQKRILRRQQMQEEPFLPWLR